MHVNDLDGGTESADNVLWKSLVRSRACFPILIDYMMYALHFVWGVYCSTRVGQPKAENLIILSGKRDFTRVDGEARV